MLTFWKDKNMEAEIPKPFSSAMGLKTRLDWSRLGLGVLPALPTILAETGRRNP
jgi:hypothetical protein